MKFLKEYKKCILGILAIVVVTISWLVVFAIPFPYRGEIETETGSLAETGYVPMAEVGVVRQQIEPDVDARILLDSIKVILLNLTGEETGEQLHITIRHDSDNRVIKEVNYSLDGVTPGEWTEIPIHAVLGIDSHSIEFTLSGDGTPYLVTQSKELRSPWNIRLWSGDKESTESLAIIYGYHNIAPVSVRIYMCFGIFLLILFLMDRVLLQDFMARHRENMLLGILLGMSIPIFVISFYSRPCVDDFSYSVMTHNLVKSGECNPVSLLRTAWQVDKHFYLTWQGLYTSAFLLALQPGIFGEKLYWLGTLSLIVLMAAVLYYVVSVLHRHLCGNAKQSFGWMMLFLIVILQGMPSPVQGLYWFNGMINYMPFVFLVMLNAVLMIESEYCGQKRRRNAFLAVSCIVSFVISGGNHITSFLNILMLLFMAVIWGIRKRYGVITSLLSAIIGFMIMYFAPGTAVRQGTIQEGSGVLRTVLEGGNRCLIDIRQWTNLQWVCCILLVIPFAYEIIKTGKIKQVRVHPVIILLLSLTMLAGMRCVPYFAIGNFGAGRSDNVIWITYMTLSIVNVIYLVVWLYYKQYFALRINIGKQKLIWAGIILVFLICISGNCQNAESTSVRAIDELVTGRAQKYAAIFDERIPLLENAPSDQILHVRALPRSELLKFDDITGSMDEWQNSAWARYYGVPTVIGFDDEQ